jgi:hypothetical protein
MGGGGVFVTAALFGGETGRRFVTTPAGHSVVHLYGERNVSLQGSAEELGAGFSQRSTPRSA